MTVKRALAALILSVMATAAASSPKPPGCGTPTTPQCENYCDTNAADATGTGKRGGR